MVFANHSKEDVTCSLPVKEIAQVWKDDLVMKKLSKHHFDKYFTRLVEDTTLLYKDSKMAIPKALPTQAVGWYHHYFQHPGLSHHEETLHAAMYWKGVCVIALITCQKLPYMSR
jgi:hypothetical protein